MSPDDVGLFFDTITQDYAAAIERCFPRYREMLWALLDYLPRSRRYSSVLELGCGTGNFSVLLQQVFPEARLHLVDVSGDSLEACRLRLGSAPKVICQQQDFRGLVYDPGSFDLIVSSIAIHHLTAPEKQRLFQQCHTWLTPDGVFSFADQCAGATQDLDRRHKHHWERLSREAGATIAEWEMWMRHQADHDHHDTLIDQMDWLREAGFLGIDCTWRYLLWSVVQARTSVSGTP